MSDVLSSQYIIETRDSVEDAVDATPNLYIVDEGFLAEHRENITRIKNESESAFQPILLVTTHDERDIAGNIWECIDDILTIPTKPTLLANRVENLVSRQKLSEEVETQRDRATTLFQTIFQSSNDAICIADLETERVKTANQAAKELFGYAETELESVHLSDLYPQSEAFSQFVQQVREEGHGRTDELLCERTSGETFPASLSSSYVEIDGRPHLINNLRDISDQKERGEEREKSEQYRKRLYEITSDSKLSFDEKIEQVLELGRERLGVENGHLVQIDVDEGSHVVLTASGSEIVQTGGVHELESTYCSKTVDSESVMALHNAPEQGWENERAFEKFGLSTYASSRLIVDGEIFGTVCFADRSPRNEPFNEREKTFVELIARWLSHELERREHTQVLRDLHGVTVDLLKGETRDEIASLAINAVEDLFETDIAAIYLVREDGDSLDAVATSKGATSLFHEELSTEQVGENPISQAFEDKDVVRVMNLKNYDLGGDYDRLQTLVCLPLGDQGVLVIGSEDIAPIDRTNHEELELLATNTGAALTRSVREQQLREVHQRRSKLFENSTDCVVEVKFDDRTPVIRDINPAFESVFGYDAEDVRGDSLQNLIVPPDREGESDDIIDRARRGEPFEAEVRRDTAQGRRDFLFRGIPIQEDNEVIGGYAVYTDITQRRRQEQQVQVLNRILRHNLRNKVSVIHAQATRIQDEVDGTVGTAVAAITKASEDLVALIEKTTQLRKANQQETTSDDVNVVSLIEEVIAEIRDEYEGATVTIDAPEQADAIGGELLRIAFYEVIENAIKHSEQPEPTVNVDITESQTAKRWTHITVADDGPGIPEMERDVLEAGLETPLQHGSGLGLWVVNWIINSLGGDFSIETSDGNGSRITFNIPKRNTNIPDTVGPPFNQPG